MFFHKLKLSSLVEILVENKARVNFLKVSKVKNERQRECKCET